MFTVSQGQRISSRCGAVKSVLGPTRLVTVEGSPAIQGFCLCSGRFSSVPTPPLLRHQSPPPSAPPSAPARQRAGGRAGAGGVGDGPSPLVAGARGSAAPGTAASTGHRVSGVGGPRPRPCRLLCPGIHRCFSYPSVLAHRRHAGGHPTTQQSSGTGPRCRSTEPEAQSPPLRPAPSVGLGPEGGSREGRRGPHPQPLPCPRPGPPGAAPAPCLPLRPGTRDPRRQPLGRAPPSGRAPPHPESTARRQPMLAAARARAPTGRMRLPRRFPFPTFGGAGLKKEKEK